MSEKAKKLLMVASIVGVIAGAIGLLTYSMLGLGQVECRLCVDFKGVKSCPTAWGPNREDAQEEAMRTACAQLAGGVTETLACQRTPATEISCSIP